MDCKEENEKLKAKADDAKNLAEQAARPIFGANWFKRTGPNLRNHVIVTYGLYPNWNAMELRWLAETGATEASQREAAHGGAEQGQGDRTSRNFRLS